MVNVNLSKFNINADVHSSFSIDFALNTRRLPIHKQLNSGRVKGF